MTSSKRARWVLWSALLAYVVLTAALLFRLPPGLAPDEAAHLDYVAYLVQHGTLPVFHGAVPPAYGYEFHQPPLYYLLCAPGWALLKSLPGYGALFCRMVSLVAGTLTVALVWWAARLLFPRRIEIAALATWFVALSPLQQGVGASANNDSLSGFWCALLFAEIAFLLQGPGSRRSLALASVCAGLALCTKETALMVAVAVLGAALAKPAMPTPLRAWQRVAWVAGPLLLVAGPWLVRNQVLYGDPFALHVFSVAATTATPGYPEFSLVGIGFFSYWRGILIMVFCTGWGFFGGPSAASQAMRPLSPHTPMPPWPLALLMLTLVGAGLAALLGAARLAERLRKGEGAALVRRVALWWSCGAGLVCVAWVWFAYNHFSGGQARYLEPMMLPLCVGTAVAWREFWGAGRAFLVSAVAVGLVLLALQLANILVWRTLA